MAAAGIRDLLIANLLVGQKKMDRLVALRRIADPLVCVDHLDQTQPISAAMAAAGLTLRVLIEVDIGMNRAGVQPGEPTLELARAVHALPGLELAGIMGYEGHLLTLADAAEKAQRIQASLGSLVATKELLMYHGLPCPIVSCGGTGSYSDTARQPGITEIQSGGAIFMDEFYRHRCHVADLENSLTVLTTVVSRPAADRAIIDAGRKTMNQELHMPTVVGRAGIHVVGLSAEHGILRLDPGVELRIGDRLELIPGYNDWTTVLHNHFFALRGERLEAIWPLEARGALQ
jgi:D-serine deaminase-like pyridoxal phosphate-dependent protein